MSQENVEVVRLMLDAFNRGDVDAVVAAFGEGCVVEEPREMPDSPSRGFRGHDGIREWMANLRGVGGVRFEPRSFATGGDVVVCELASHGSGRTAACPLSGRPSPCCRMRDGKIACAQAFLSRDEALEAAGLSE